MSQKSSRNKKILLRLADKLSDKQLGGWFPEMSPAQVRELLVQVAHACPENCKVRSPDRAQANRPRNTDIESKVSTRSSGQVGQCLLYTDGASRGNPGEAGAGYVILDEGRQELLTGSSYLGKCTNNVAEYQALITGLEAGTQLGCKDLRIFLDSELIVRQIQGVYKVKNAGLKALFIRVQKLLNGYVRWDIQHVPRAKNKRADELANRGIDEK